MEKASKILAAIILAATLCSCATFQGSPAPPLKDSELVFQLKEGIYTSSAGTAFVVDSDLPMWAVPEGKVYDLIAGRKSFWEKVGFAAQSNNAWGWAAAILALAVLVRWFRKRHI
jgi:hypothetical protein